jgi:hypothetical protein
MFLLALTELNRPWSGGEVCGRKHPQIRDVTGGRQTGFQ